MAGLVFIRTAMRPELVLFYTQRVGMSIWLEQPAITILNHENFLVGFQDTGPGVMPDTESLLTFFYPRKEDVERMYAEFEALAVDRPKLNKRYRIYNFFARDPEGRRTEFQCFLHEIDCRRLCCGWDGTPPHS